MSSPEDDIQDDSSDIESKEYVSRQEESKILSIRKRPFSHDIGGFFAASQKFRKSSDGSKAPLVVPEQKSWTDKYKPSNLDELSVHRKKLSDVRSWLERVFNGDSYQSLLVLKGAAGTGKTSTVSLLSDVLAFEILEWRNPDIAESSSHGYASLSAQFEDFVNKSKQYGTLDLIYPDGSRLEKDMSTQKISNTDISKQISLVEEYPNISTRFSGATESFRSTILQYLSAGAPKSQNAFRKSDVTKFTNPLILIISESSISNNTVSTDSFTAHRLLGPEIINHPRTTVIEFNAIAPTIMTKALNLILQKHFRSTGERYSPDVQIIQRLSEVGDIRNATSMLEFYCKQAEDLSGKLTVRSKKSNSKIKNKLPKTPYSSTSTDASLSLIAQRDSTLSLFHTIGKVVYNKRRDASLSQTEPPLPSHHITRARPLPPENEPSILFNTAGTEISTFLASLHENYLLSCYDPSGDSEASLDCVNDCIEMLSSADLLHSSSDGTQPRNSRQSTAALGTSEALTQAELAFHVGVRGLLFGLPHPVKRPATTAGQHARDANRMFYPASLKIWRRREELGDLLNLLVVQHYTGRLQIPWRPSPSSITTPLSHSSPSAPKSSNPSFKPTVPIVRTKPQKLPHREPVTATSSAPITQRVLWARPKPLQAPQPPPSPGAAAAPGSSEPQTSQENAIVALGSGCSAAREMLLERLPYFAQILRATKGPAGVLGTLLRDVENVTRFTGGDVLAEDGESDLEDDGDSRRIMAWGTQKAGAAAAGASFGGVGSGEWGEQKLVLSDDDIEDD